jgi:hypothetical protein
MEGEKRSLKKQNKYHQRKKAELTPPKNNNPQRKKQGHNPNKTLKKTPLSELFSAHLGLLLNNGFIDLDNHYHLDLTPALCQAFFQKVLGIHPSGFFFFF